MRIYKTLWNVSGYSQAHISRLWNFFSFFSCLALCLGNRIKKETLPTSQTFHKSSGERRRSLLAKPQNKTGEGPPRERVCFLRSPEHPAPHRHGFGMSGDCSSSQGLDSTSVTPKFALDLPGHQGTRRVAHWPYPEGRQACCRLFSNLATEVGLPRLPLPPQGPGPGSWGPCLPRFTFQRSGSRIQRKSRSYSSQKACLFF